MKSIRTYTTLAALSLLSAGQAFAVEGVNALPLWLEDDTLHFGLSEQYNAIDFAPGTAGKELIGVTETVSAQTVASESRMVWRQRFQFRNAATGAQLAQFTVTTRSGWYSNNDAANNYFCNGEFTAQLELDNSIADCDSNITAGIAETQAGGRYLVIGTSAVIEVEGPGETLADVFRVNVIDLATNTIAWANTWTLLSPNPGGDDWELDPAFAAVGDFLGDDGTDELRILQSREQGPSQRFRYRFYDITTGALLSTRAFSMSPP